jgi:hypothetical protein
MNTVVLAYATLKNTMSEKTAGRPSRRTPLRVWLESKNISPSDFAGLIGIAERTLMDFMGGRKPPLAVARRIKEVSKGELDLDALLDFESKAA